MSTKIFNAYLFDGSKQELLDFLKIYSDEKENRQSLLNKMLGYDIKGYINDLLTSADGSVEKLGSLLQNSELTYTFEPDEFSQEYREHQEKSVVVYDTAGTKVAGKQLIQLFVDHKGKLSQEIIKNPKFKEFYYTNSSDMDISRAEEKLREKTWDIIFKGSAVPGVVGETYSIYNFFNEYDSNPQQMKKEMSLVMNSIYQKKKSPQELENSFDTIESNLRCKEIRRQENKDEKISDSEDYGGTVAFMRIYRKADNEKKEGVPLPKELQDKMNAIKVSSKFLPDDLPESVVLSAVKRLDLVKEKTINMEESRLKSMKDYGLESDISKPAIKL